ncbi:sporadically distributed protein, TIGR04141 family [Arthrobacter sp. OV608]|nr:DUF6119 family protein [Arthrobacter sp. OV608]SEQ69448.1 sporadically distributed protein, TIGR04141 family [Arthrobacter sp. OV608]
MGDALCSAHRFCLVPQQDPSDIPRTESYLTTRSGSRPTPTTLYRLTDVGDFHNAIREKYLDMEGFETWECTVGDCPAVLIQGHIETERTKWSGRVSKIIDQEVSARNTTAAAVLLIRAERGVTWALSYGMGFFLLEQAHIDPGFGQRVAIRAADSENLNSLTRKTMDDRAKVDRSSIPSGAQLRGFGIGGFGELVTRLVATAEIPGLSIGKSFKLRGADALSVPLAQNPTELLSDLAAIEDVLAKPAIKELEILEHLVAIKKSSDTATKLDALLAGALVDPANSSISVAWPHEHVDENGTPDSFVIKGNGPRMIRPGIPGLEDIIGVIAQKGVLHSLERVKIQLFSDADAETAISTDIALRKWVAFETILDGKRYFLHNGTWYLMDSDYANHLAKRVQEIFDRQWDVELPHWPEDSGENECHEKDYNAIAAKACGGLLLDRKLIYTRQNRRGFEACDILTPDGTLVHVKNIDSSAPASHLFAQGHNSAHTLMSDSEARDKLRALVTKAGGDPELVKSKPPAVVFGIARRKRKPLSAESLYSFSQVTLVRTVDELDARGIKVFVAPIENGPTRA